jgi:hypothetical protein
MSVDQRQRLRLFETILVHIPKEKPVLVCDKSHSYNSVGMIRLASMTINHSKELMMSHRLTVDE